MAEHIWLITGASSGFGTVLAEAVLKHGHAVIITARNTEKARKSHLQIESLGGKWLSLDVTSPSTPTDVEKAIRDLAGGRIDVLVNNAGYSLIGSLEDMSVANDGGYRETEIHTQIDTNLYGPIRVIKGVLPFMRAQKSGTIVNISSIAGLDGRLACALYAASKFALEGLSETLSSELAPFNICTLIVEPGVFRTNFLGAFITPEAGMNGAYKGTILEQTIAAFHDLHEKQAGDPVKGAERIFDVVTGTGVGEGKTGLLRLPFGPDCLQRVRNKVQNLRENIDEMEQIALSTDYN